MCLFVMSTEPLISLEDFRKPATAIKPWADPWDRTNGSHPTQPPIEVDVTQKASPERPVPPSTLRNTTRNLVPVIRELPDVICTHEKGPNGKISALSDDPFDPSSEEETDSESEYHPPPQPRTLNKFCEINVSFRLPQYSLTNC